MISLDGTMHSSGTLLRSAREVNSTGVPAKREGPRYLQLVTLLMRRLAAKEWKPGVALPGEHALALEYGVSHGTMRKAIDQMVTHNLLVRRQGKGTFVATHDGSRALAHFFRLVDDNGMREIPYCTLIERETGRATAVEADKLQIREGANVLRFLRVRGTETRPFIVERLALPASRFPNLRSNPMTDLPSLLYEYYCTRYGVIVVEAVERLRVAHANEQDARLLKLQPDHPLLEIDRIALDVGQKPVEWRRSHCETSHHYYLNRFG